MKAASAHNALLCVVNLYGELLAEGAREVVAEREVVKQGVRELHEKLQEAETRLVRLEREVGDRDERIRVLTDTVTRLLQEKDPDRVSKTFTHARPGLVSHTCVGCGRDVEKCACTGRAEDDVGHEQPG